MGRTFRTGSSEPNSGASHASQFVREFIRRHVAPNQRVQADLPLQPGATGASYHVNLAPQSTRLARKRPPRPRPSLNPVIVKPKKRVDTRQLSGDLKEISWSLVTRLHQLWLGYAQTVTDWNRLVAQSQDTPVSNASLSNQLELILRINLTGAKVCVIRSSSACVAGYTGFVVMESKYLLRLALAPSDSGSHPTGSQLVRVVSVPKPGSLFALMCCSLVNSTFESIILLNGEHLAHRPVDRALRKWRRPSVTIPLSRKRTSTMIELWGDVLDACT